MAAEHDPAAILQEFADSSMLAPGTLKGDIDGGPLREAIRMIDGAHSLYVIGQRRAFPVAACFAYGLTRLEYPCHLLNSVGGMLPQQVATIGKRDVLLAVRFAECAPPVVKAVSDAHIRKFPVLAITDSPASPLARDASLCFVVRDAECVCVLGPEWFPAAPVPLFGIWSALRPYRRLRAREKHPAGRAGSCRYCE